MINNEILEEQLRQIFINDWNNKNIQLICEVPVFSRSVDLVKFNLKNKTITALEFKKHNFKQVLKQIKNVEIVFDFLEICIIKPKTEKSQKNIIETCKKLGIGLYFFDTTSKEFEYKLFPKKVKNIWELQKNKIITYLISKNENMED